MASHKPHYPQQVLLIIAALAGPWLALVAVAALALGLDHQLTPCFIAAGALITPIAAHLPLPENMPAKREIDHLTLLIGFAWLAVSMLQLFTFVDPANVWVFIAAMFLGSIVLPLTAVARKHQRR